VAVRVGILNCDSSRVRGPPVEVIPVSGLPTTGERSVRSALRRYREVIVQARHRVSMCLFALVRPSRVEDWYVLSGGRCHLLSMIRSR
jgi:hypothetical protein